MNGKKGGVGGKDGIKRKGFPKSTEEEDDDVLSNPMLSNTTTNTTKKLKPAPLPPDDDFLDESPLTTSTKSPKKAELAKNLKPALLSPSPPSSSSSSSSLRRSASADSDDFLYFDPFNPNATPSKRNSEESEEDREEAVRKLKIRLEKELEPTIPRLQGIWRGTIRSELAEKYKKGGKERKGMKWDLGTGGFSEQEFDLIIDLLQRHFPQCDLHYITDVLWQEAALKLLMERKKLGSQKKAESILKAVELSSVDRKELRRYQSDSSLLVAVAKYQEMLNSPNSSQEKKKSKSPSSSQEKPSSQDRKSPSPSPSTYYSQPPAPQADLSKYSFKKQNIFTNNGSVIKETLEIKEKDTKEKEKDTKEKEKEKGKEKEKDTDKKTTTHTKTYTKTYTSTKETREKQTGEKEKDTKTKQPTNLTQDWLRRKTKTR